MKSTFSLCLWLSLSVSHLAFASYSYKMENLSNKVKNKKTIILNKMKNEGFTELLLNQLSEVNKEGSFVHLYYLSKAITLTLVELKTKEQCTGSITYDLSERDCEKREEQLMEYAQTFGIRLSVIDSENIKKIKEKLIKHRRHIAAHCTDKKEVTHATVDKNLIACLDLSGYKDHYKEKVVKLYTDEIY